MRARAGSALVRTVLGGWEVGDITILQSGTPFSVFCSRQFQFGTLANGQTDTTTNVGCDYNADGFDYDRPNAPSTGNTIRGASKQQFLKGLFPCTGSLCSNVFSAPALGQEGTLGRNTYRSPGFAGSDVSVLKNTRFSVIGKEPLNLQIRAEATNVFNRVNLSSVTGDISSGTFGQATNTYAPRQFQFGARVVF